MKTILFFILLCSLCTSIYSHGQTNLYFHFKDTIPKGEVGVAFAFLEGDDRVKVKARQIKKNTWQLSIPDSLYHRYVLSRFYFISKNHRDSLAEYSFYMEIPQRKDTLNIGNIYHLPLHSTHTFRLKFLRQYPPQKGRKCEAIYLLKKPTEGDMLNAQLASGNRPNPGDFIRMLEDHPQSGIIARWAFFLIDRDITMEQLDKFHSLLSTDDQNSYMGNFFYQNRRNYLEAKADFTYELFPNMLLEECQSGEQEAVIKNPAKYNLVVFSHAYCQPCHLTIPLLKEIHEDLKGNLEMTYISMDDQKSVGVWKKLMVTKEIPWRSLLTTKHKDKVSNKYQAFSYPTFYLVHPSGKFEKLEIRDQNDKERLYRLVRDSLAEK